MFRTCSSVVMLCLLAMRPAAAQEPAERTQREASNPLRMIIEASKIRPRVKPADKPAEKPADRAPAPPVAPAPRAAASPAPTATTARAPAEAAASAPAPATAAPVAAVERPPREQPESAVATVELAAAVPEAPPPAPAEPLRLVNIVEPVPPRALRASLRGEVLVHVAFTIEPDGSVRDPSVRSTSHPQLAPSVLTAVRQWRYEPIAQAREHEVEIVLRQD